MKTARDELRVWLLYVAAIMALTWVAFGGLRLHQLDTHDAESFADHLRIEQDGSYFFSPHKEQATGRLFADAVKYATFLVFGNDAAAFHLLVVAAHMLAALLLALLLRRMGLAIEWALCAGLLFCSMSLISKRYTIFRRSTTRLVWSAFALRCSVSRARRAGNGAISLR